MNQPGQTTAIYHITHLRNLPGILEQGGLWCDAEAARRKLIQVGIAHQHIKQRRAAKVVPCAAGGSLADYVPFYFAPRSPMLFAIHRGNVQGYADGQAPVAHLVSSVETVVAAGRPFAFTDGHAEMSISRFFTDPADLGEIDWDILRAKYWADTLEDGDRTRRRQAEFLVYSFFPWPWVREIGVLNLSMAQQTRALLQNASTPVSVSIRPAWYY